MKINLGCGARKLDGFVNVDLPAEQGAYGVQPDVEADVSGPMPFKTGCADEVHAYHVFEHIYRWQAEDVLAEWIRLVAPGGVLVLELPCLDKVLALFDHFIKQKQPVPVNLTLWGLYGDPKYRSDKMVHRWCYSVAELTDMLESLGCAVTEEKPQTHQPVRDMRLVARKV